MRFPGGQHAGDRFRGYPIPADLVVLVAGAVSLAIALTAGLWAYYGTAVFFEMLRRLGGMFRPKLSP